MTTELSLEERETNISIMASDRTTVTVYSDDPVMIKRLDRIALSPGKSVGAGKVYVLTSKQLTLKPIRKPASQETREKRALILKKAREAKK